MKISIILVIVIVSNQIQNTGFDNVVAGIDFVITRGDWSGGVKFLHDPGEFTCDRRSGRIPLFTNFISDTPDNNTWMIPVPANEILEILLVPFIPIMAVIEW